MRLPEPTHIGFTPEEREILKNHEHQYTIPVEWEKQNYDATFDVFRRQVVTKLRCSCGDEVER